MPPGSKTTFSIDLAKIRLNMISDSLAAAHLKKHMSAVARKLQIVLQCIAMYCSVLQCLAVRKWLLVHASKSLLSANLLCCSDSEHVLCSAHYKTLLSKKDPGLTLQAGLDPK